MAFRTRRRRKPLVQWLPTQHTSVGAGVADAAAPGGVQGQLGNSGLTADFGEIIYDAFPLTFDSSIQSIAVLSTASEPEQNPTLADIVGGNEYRLRRIVGKFHAFARQDETDSPSVNGSIVRCGLGFIVCNTYDDGTPLTDFTEVNPLAANSMEDPWIWRRTWMLNPAGDFTFNVSDDLRNNLSASNMPVSTAGYGSAVDGPHIDQKTARRITRGQRLFAVVACTQWRLDSLNPYADTQVTYFLDYRLLGSIHKAAAGNRRRASR